MDRLNETAHEKISVTESVMYVGMCVHICIVTQKYIHTYICNEGESIFFFSLKEYSYLSSKSKLVADLKLKILNF